MTSVFGRSRMFCGFVGLFAATSWAGIDTPTLSLKAVKLNEVAISATNSIVAGPGDIIECEVFLSEWSPSPGEDAERLRAFQVSIPRASFNSGSRGTVLPLGWDRPILSKDDVGCFSDADCIAEIPEFPVCSSLLCTGPDYEPTLGVFLTAERPDWVFWCAAGGAPCGAFSAVDISGVSIRYASTLISAGDAPTYAIPPKYAGTMIVEVSGDACGDFSLEILQPPSSNLTDQNTIPILPIVTEALTIQTGSCDCRSVIDSVPPNCTVDARQPKDLDGAVQTQNTMTLTFDCEDASGIANADAFTVDLLPGGFEPTILDVTSVGNEVTITVIPPFPEFKWTCITFDASGDQTCVGIMPGDTNSNVQTELSDIPALINCLNDPGSCTLYQCDMNRSDGCHPHDLLRLIDLLIGADPYIAYEDEGILFLGNPFQCPSAP